MDSNINQVLMDLLAFRKERDWEKFHSPRNLSISISIEAAELLEIFQWQIGEMPMTSQLKEEAEKEIADIFIYLLLISNDLNIDLLEVTRSKIEENKKRYPVEKAYGNATKNDKL
jgi:NTP pyrophosphatase (non-canonical NTP hydrolase)